MLKRIIEEEKMFKILKLFYVLHIMIKKKTSHMSNARQVNVSKIYRGFSNSNVYMDKEDNMEEYNGPIKKPE